MRLKRGHQSLLTWKNSFIRTILISFIFLFLLIGAGPEESQGAVSAPSDSSFMAPAAVVPGGKISVFYFLGGGIQSPYNPAEYSAFSGEQRLQAPHRSGYRFVGWYLDRGFHRQVTVLPGDEMDHYVLYARWTPKINNHYNVENYKYRSETRTGDKRNTMLKNLNYQFLDKINIPGMPDTRSDDLLNRYIFSESQCPQGVCLTDEFVLITSYSVEDDCMGELMVFDRETGEYMITLGMDENSHLGGIAFDGDNVWLCNSHEREIERISYDFITTMAYRNRGEVVDARDVVDCYKVKNTPSCITYYGGRLWIASHTSLAKSQMKAYYYKSSENKLEVLSSFQIPSKVQGVAFDSSGRIYLSTSFGRDKSSYLYQYDSVAEMSAHPKYPSRTVEMPPCSEELDVKDDMLYVLFESAGEKYLEGTDGKGKSLSPIDKILMIPLDQFS